MHAAGAVVFIFTTQPLAPRTYRNRGAISGKYMPWTRRQVKYLLSNGSPLSGQQQTKMKGELHAEPSMGHMKKGFKSQAHSYDSNRPKKQVVSRYK